MRLGVLAGSFTFSGTAQCLLVNFTDELKQLEVNNSVARERAASPQWGCSPCNQGCWGALCPWERQQQLGCPPLPAPSTGCGSSWAGVSCTSWAASPLPSSSSYNHWYTSSASPYFYFPFLFRPFSLFPPFFPGATEAEWPQAAPQSLYVHTQPWLAFVTPHTHTRLAM